jgi:hypothetical protein
MGQLEPGLGERELEFLRVVQEALGDLAVGWVELQRQVRREHDRRVADALHVGVGDRVAPAPSFGVH